MGSAVRGPTCVWARDPDADSRTDFGVLTTVPAVSGRLLRFDGELMHAVPKPPNVWLPVAERRNYKGVMDAILCGEGSTANVAKMCSAVWIDRPDLLLKIARDER